MSWFAPAEGLSDKARECLEQLANSGQSEAAAVADCLNTIAENGDGQEDNWHLLGCADEIIDAAKAFIQAVKPSLFDSLVHYAHNPKPVEEETIIMATSEQPGLTRYLQGTPLWTAFGERAFRFANQADAQWFLDNYPEELTGAETFTWRKREEPPHAP